MDRKNATFVVIFYLLLTLFGLHHRFCVRHPHPVDWDAMEYKDR